MLGRPLGCLRRAGRAERRWCHSHLGDCGGGLEVTELPDAMRMPAAVALLTEASLVEVADLRLVHEGRESQLLLAVCKDASVALRATALDKRVANSCLREVGRLAEIARGVGEAACGIIARSSAEHVAHLRLGQLCLDQVVQLRVGIRCAVRPRPWSSLWMP